MCLVHNETSNKSRLVIIDADDFSAAPVASIELPYAVPYGAHGNWIADQQILIPRINAVKPPPRSRNPPCHARWFLNRWFPGPALVSRANNMREARRR